MPRIGHDAMEAALTHFHDNREQMQTKVASMWEAFLAGKVFLARNISEPTVAHANEVVTHLFEIDPTLPDGRLRPFRYSWLALGSSGRKTVWNQTTRHPNLSTSLFNEGANGIGDIREGLRDDAAHILRDNSPALPAKEALTALLVRNVDFDVNASWNDAHAMAQETLGMSPQEYDEITDGSSSFTLPLIADPSWRLVEMPKKLQPPETSTVSAPVNSPQSQGQQERTELVLAARTERMIRRAVSRFPFIMLVGPPGTGKGTLISWITEEVQANPEAFGFQPGFVPSPIWRTPDESWSAFDLIGGLAPDEDGSLQWSPGALLNAVDADRWLVLDETNRADMDKIMGPLLTWLSHQEVEVGRDAAHGGHPIVLDWGSQPESEVEDGTYLAGTSWRLFGTYNPADAQRVFRLGLALSRRFVVIPIPAVEPQEFQTLLSTKMPELDPDISDAVSALYSAHFTDPHTQLGPAVFLRIAEYLSEDPNAAAAPFPELVAEGYVVSLGKYVAAYEDNILEALGVRLTAEGAITEEEWVWIKSHRDTLG